MTDKMRYRYGDTNPVVAAVDSETVIEIGDLLWQDLDDAKPASQPDPLWVDIPATVPSRPTEESFAASFLGVAIQRSSSRETEPIRVAATGVFEFDCPRGTFELGNLVGIARVLDHVPEFDEPIYKLVNQRIVEVTNPKLAIGRVAKREPTPVTSVLVDIRSTVMTGGVAGSSPSGV